VVSIGRVIAASGRVLGPNVRALVVVRKNNVQVCQLASESDTEMAAVLGTKVLTATVNRK
jgi:hypothetical protein